ncbi:MAG: insulinase family protein [Clostridiales bacterium]|jgi:Zn-dependent M16 (insulinase) family peptidase|nr:insulinase family protein [Clostridiales bacterium]
MKMNIPSGYRLVFDEKLDDLNGWGAYVVHEKTGAKIALIKNEDSNKVFSIGFRTPPKNSTGVSHIIEHSVLCGSERFPAKDSFVELAKGSLNTFLNAMTYADRTLYPVASQNDQDFKNLMHVYLDAVLFPNIYNRKEIFDQEAWHYHLENEGDELQINGVVYNEMKGVFSSPEQQLLRLNQNTLFPDTCYGVESGGDPEFIPELTYEEFLEFHRRYYHPSNSYIYLYGDMDFEERLIWIDKEYLSKFDYLEVDSKIAVQNGFDELKEIEAFYSLGEDESPIENTYLSLNIAIGEDRSEEISLGFQILDYVLYEAPGAPVKQALLDAGIGKDILSQLNSEYLQISLSIIAKNADEDQKEEFLSVIRSTLSKLVEEGLNEKSLLGAINLFEFKYREADYGSYPKGLMCGLRVMKSWLYDEDKPFHNLKDNILYDKMKKQVGTGFYEQLIKDYMLNNSHASLVILKPKVGLNKIREAETKERLTSYKKSLSKDEIQNIISDTIRLKRYQETPSTKEEVETIPLLTREDIGPDPQPIYNEEKTIDGVRLVHHDVFTNEIAYIRLLFDVKDIPKELVPYLSLLSSVLGYVDTDNYSYLEYSNEVNLHTGGIYHDLISFSIKDKIDDYSPKYEVGAKVMYDKLPEASILIEEVLYRTQLKDYKRLKEIIDEMKSRMQMIFQSSSHMVAVNRVMSYYSIHGLFKENTQGISFYQFLDDLNTNYGQLKDTIIEKLKKLMEMVFVKDKLIVSITADKAGYDAFLKGFTPLMDSLREKISERQLSGYDNLTLKPRCLNEGFKSAMQVQYVARAGNYFKVGYKYTGALKVLRMILSYDYLWNNVRVKGGAYGCMCGFSGVDGDVYFTSYRDPNLKVTNLVYENIPEFIRNYTADDRDMTKSIIGTISTLDTPLTPKTKGIRSLSMLLTGLSYEDLKKERDDIINVTLEDIRSLDKLIQSVLDQGYICVIGNESKIEEDSDLFNEVKNLMK